MITGSLTSDDDFEVIKVENSYQISETNKLDSLKQDNEIYSMSNDIKNNLNNPKAQGNNTFLYKNQQNKIQSNISNRKESYEYMKGVTGNNVLRLNNQDYRQNSNNPIVDMNQKER